MLRTGLGIGSFGFVGGKMAQQCFSGLSCSCVLVLQFVHKSYRNPKSPWPGVCEKRPWTRGFGGFPGFVRQFEIVAQRNRCQRPGPLCRRILKKEQTEVVKIQ